MPHELDIDDIKQIVPSYANTACRMRTLGYNGVDSSYAVGALSLLVCFYLPSLIGLPIGMVTVKNTLAGARPICQV
jgi:hypothetical protein